MTFYSDGHKVRVIYFLIKLDRKHQEILPLVGNSSRRKIYLAAGSFVQNYFGNIRRRLWLNMQLGTNYLVQDCDKSCRYLADITRQNLPGTSKMLLPNGHFLLPDIFLFTFTLYCANFAFTIQYIVSVSLGINKKSYLVAAK